MEISRPENWTGLPFPSPGDLPRSPALWADSLPAEPPGKPILKEIGPEYSLEGLMMKLKLQYFGHLMQRIDSLEKMLMWERLKERGEGDEED